MTTLSGKTALVTGASRGIGRASALALANAGAVAADLAAPDGPHKLAKQVRAIVGDRLDILVANAGISKAATIEDYTVEDFDNLFAVNVRAPFFLIQQLLPILGSGGSVILLSSLAAHAIVGTLSAYAATKGAIDTLVKHFAFVLGAREIRVNAVAPRPLRNLGLISGRRPDMTMPSDLRRAQAGVPSRLVLLTKIELVCPGAEHLVWRVTVGLELAEPIPRKRDVLRPTRGITIFQAGHGWRPVRPPACTLAAQEELSIRAGQVHANQVVTLNVAFENLRLARRTHEKMLHDEIAADPLLPDRKRRQRDRPLPLCNEHGRPTAPDARATGVRAP
jgi:3-oxoacyl-[acyl-carrier protein] reductase